MGVLQLKNLRLVTAQKTCEVSLKFNNSPREETFSNFDNVQGITDSEL